MDISGLVSFFGNFIVGIVNRLKTIFPWIRRRLERPVLVRIDKNNSWSLGSSNHQPSMHIKTCWKITNDSKRNVSIVSAVITSPKAKVVNSNIVMRLPNREIYAQYELQSGASTILLADFTVQPLIAKVGKDLMLNIIFTDNYGQTQEHTKIHIKGIGDQNPKRWVRQAESIDKITSKVEKQVVYILRDEVSRYKISGRSTGGLGSVYTLLEGNKLKGVTTESWIPGKSYRQNLDTSNAAIVDSDNLQALLKLFNLSSNEERHKLQEALIKRLSYESEYYCVAYLILLFFFKTQQLSVALEHSITTLKPPKPKKVFFLSIFQKNNMLPPEDYQSWGFSDFLRILDGLLKFEHRNFTEQELDLIGKFIENESEPSFLIKERVAAIYSYSLNNLP